MDDFTGIARTQHGLIFTSDLYALGFDRNSMRRATAGLVRIARGAYTLTEPRTEEQRHLLRTVAILRRRPRDIAAGVSAAVIHRLPLFDVDLAVVHVRSPGTGKKTAAGLHVHRGSVADAVVVNDIPVTPIAQTLADCARLLTLPQGVAMLDQALHEDAVSRQQLEDALASPSTGVSRARRALALADGRAESVGESRTRVILLDAGIPVTPQVTICEPDGTFIARVDLLVDGTPVIVEFDGAEKYQHDPARHMYEKRRQERLQDAGYVVVHIYWEELYTPQALVAKVRRALHRVAA